MRPAKQKRPIRPTVKKIQSQIYQLTQIKGLIRNRSLTGEDNWGAIDAQIAVLSRGLTESQIRARYEPGSCLEDPSASPYVLEHALQARRWLNGNLEGHGDLVDGWKKLLKASRL